MGGWGWVIAWRPLSLLIATIITYKDYPTVIDMKSGDGSRAGGNHPRRVSSRVYHPTSPEQHQTLFPSNFPIIAFPLFDVINRCLCMLSRKKQFELKVLLIVGVRGYYLKQHPPKHLPTYLCSQWLISLSKMFVTAQSDSHLLPTAKWTKLCHEDLANYTTTVGGVWREKHDRRIK